MRRFVFLHEPKTRHLGSVRIPPSMIANLLKLPEDAEIRSITVDEQINDIIVVVEHPNLQPVPESCHAPPLELRNNVEWHTDSESGQEFWTYHVRPMIPGVEQ